MWVIPVETTDFTASEVGLADLETSLERVSQFFAEQSYDQLALDVVFEPRDHWVRLPGTATDFGFDKSRPQQDFSSVMEEILKAWKPSGNVAQNDLVLAVLPPVPEVVVTMSTRRWDQKRFNNVLLENGVLLSSGGNEIRSWELHAHEIGHSLMRLEDLYHGRADVPYEEYMGKWDIMDNASGSQPTFSSWSRWRSGWIRDDEVLCVDAAEESTHFVGQLDEPDAEFKTLVVPRSDHSVVVIDVRRIANASKPVALTYVVDTSKEHQLGPYRVKTQFYGEDTVEVEGVTLTLVARDSSGVVVSVAPAP
jgi:M6 family metalloprotease-like protein